MPKSGAERAREYRARKKAQRNALGQNLMETKSLTSTIIDDNESIVKNEPLQYCEDIPYDNNHMTRDYRQRQESSDAHLETKSSTSSVISCIVKKEPLELDTIVDKDIKRDNNYSLLDGSQTKSLTSPINDDNLCIVKKEPLEQNTDFHSLPYETQTKSSTDPIIEENVCVVKKDPLEQNTNFHEDIPPDNNHFLLDEYRRSQESSHAHLETKSCTIIEENLSIVKKEPLEQNTIVYEDISRESNHSVLHENRQTQESSDIYQDSKSSTGTIIDDNICIVKNEPLEQNFIVYEDMSRDNNQSLLREYPQCPGNLDVNHQDSSSTSEHIGGNTEQLSDCSGNVQGVRERLKIPKTPAERSREYRKRKKIIRDLIYEKMEDSARAKIPKTPAERAREYRKRKKIMKDLIYKKMEDSAPKTLAQRRREYRTQRKDLKNLNAQTSASELSTSTRNTLTDIHVQQPDHIEDPIDNLCLLQFL